MFCASKYSCVEENKTLEMLEELTRSVNDIQAQDAPLDEINVMRRNKIKEMMKHSWDNYVKYAWGENELWPKSKRGNSRDSFGSAPLGASIIVGLDTLYIMGMMDEFRQG